MANYKICGDGIIEHRRRIDLIRERRSLIHSGSRMGRWYFVRVLVLIAGVVALTWYGKGGGNPFAKERVIRVAGDTGGYGVDCLVIGKKDAVRVGRVDAGRAPAVDSETARLGGYGAFDRKSVHPFADSVTAVLLTFEKVTALVCDSSILTERPDGTRSEFFEKVDLLVVPPASEEGILAIRGQFRPKLLAVAPPCAVPSTQNIVCIDDGNGEFRYDFVVKSGKITKK